MFGSAEVHVTGSESYPRLVSGIRGAGAVRSSRSTETCPSKTRTHSALGTSFTNLFFSLLQTADLLSEQDYLARPTANHTREQQIFPGDGNPILYTRTQVVKEYKVYEIRTSLFIHYTGSFEQACALKVSI
jgi:hypothetical protein